ncbi:RpiB/LacA/LacB family sugar-phosphate isomerase [bacterium]|nr:RpiB/LacA/LacB family sugar-phosphate isomerase [bacterium]
MIYLGNDHAGYLVKEAIKNYLEKNKIDYEDLGSNSLESANYQEYAFKVAEKVALNPKIDKGILICGTGVGVCIAANKVKGVLAGLVDKKELSEYVVSHDHCNILCLSGLYVNIHDNLEIVKKFLETERLHDYH